jgi:hypothetical protein
VGYSTDGRKWPKGVCRLNLTGPGWDPSWQTTARSAFAIWNAGGASFTFVEDATPSANVHLSSYKFRSAGWIALTQLEPDVPGSFLTGRDVLVNLWYEFDPPHPSTAHGATKGPYHLQTVLAHEFGHLLHLAEDQSGAATMMRPTIKPNEQRNLHRDDIAGIRHLYP